MEIKEFQATVSMCSVFKVFGEGSKYTLYADQLETAPVLGLERVTDLSTVLPILLEALTMDSATL